MKPVFRRLIETVESREALKQHRILQTVEPISVGALFKQFELLEEFSSIALTEASDTQTEEPEAR